jgi:hypothetical protein
MLMPGVPAHLTVTSIVIRSLYSIIRYSPGVKHIVAASMALWMPRLVQGLPEVAGVYGSDVICWKTVG